MVHKSHHLQTMRRAPVVLGSRFPLLMSMILLLLLLTRPDTFGYLTDSASHVPATTGQYDYNSWKPGAAGFPAVGSSYVDPIFGESIVRLTAISGANDDQNYSRNGFHNADATKCFSWQNSGGLKILDSRTGAVLYTNMPRGTYGSGVSFDPVDPNKYYYISGNTIRQVVLQGGGSFSDTLLKNFGFALGNLGGSNDYIDNSGRYWVVENSGSNLAHVWDKQLDVLYANPISRVSSGGWTGILPDGSGLVDVAGSTAVPQKEHWYYSIDHGTQSVSTTHIQFWGLSGDHGDLISPSDGNNYFICFNSGGNTPGLWRVKVTQNLAGHSVAQQEAANTRLVPAGWYDADGHISAVSKGANRDWVFWSATYTTGDNFNSNPSLNWAAYRQELIMVNVLTGETRRLAHHRSRDVDTNYFYNPRVSASWDGTRIIWTSNFNVNTPTGYADLYMMKPSGPTSDTTPPVAPKSLRVQ